MEPKELAELLDGRTFLREMTRMEEQLAKDFGLVVVFGNGPDSIEYRGSINNHMNAYHGGEMTLSKNGFEWKDNPNGNGEWIGDNRINAVWKKGKTKDGKRVSWSFDTDIPHEEFVIYDDDEPYCIGIVFKMENLR